MNICNRPGKNSGWIWRGTGASIKIKGKKPGESETLDLAKPGRGKKNRAGKSKRRGGRNETAEATLRNISESVSRKEKAPNRLLVK